MEELARCEKAYKTLNSHHQALSDKYGHMEQSFLRENDDLKRQVSRLKYEQTQERSRVEARANMMAQRLDDVFDNTLDQVSEADVKSHGPFSVIRLNDLVDELVTNVIEDMKTISKPRLEGGVTSPWEPRSSNLLVSALKRSMKTNEDLELLLDAMLRDVVINRVYARFFVGQVAAWTSNQTPVPEVESLYVSIREFGMLKYTLFVMPCSDR